MPASRLPRQGKRRPLGAIIALGCVALLAVVVVVVVALPASLLGRALPPTVRASEFSGSLWHGAAGRIFINGHDSGALEWRLHPGELVRLKVGIDATWARGAFALVASGFAGTKVIEANSIRGGGTLEDVAALTGMSGWRGNVSVAINRLTANSAGLESMAGDVSVAGLHTVSIANDADLGGYTLHFDAPAADGAGTIDGQLSDTGSGPLQVQGIVALSPREHTGTLTGTVHERSAASPALRQSLEQLAQMRPRDAAGNVPLDVEFSW